MASDLRQLARHGSIYSIGIILGRVISFLMIPLYTNLLTPSDYGVLQLLSLTSDVITTLVGIGMTTAVMRFYYKYDDEKNQNLSVSSALTGIFTLMALCASISMLFAADFSKLVFSNTEYILHFRIVFLTMLLTAGIEIPLVFIRAKQRSLYFVTINLIKLIAQLGLNVFFLVVLKMGVLGVLYSGLITSGVLCIYLLYYTFRETGLKFSYDIFKKMVVFGGPLLISNLATFVLTFSDHFILNHYSDLTSVGLYSLAYKFGILVSSLIIAPFQQIWGARMFEIAKKEDAAVIVSKVLLYFLLLTMGVSLALSILTKDFLKIIANPSYWNAYMLVPVISLAYVINGVIYVVNLGIMVKDKTKYIATSTIVAMIVNIVLNFTLIPKWGGHGAAYATLISYMVRLALIYRYSQRLFYIKYRWKNIVVMSGLYLAMILLAFSITFNNVFASIGFNVLVVLTFPVLIYVTGVFNSNEKELIRKFVRHPVTSTRSFVRTR